MNVITFICHNDHLVSKSISFMVESLAKKFIIKVVPYDYGYTHMDSLLYSDADLYIFWQTEFLARWFIDEGKKVVVFPMYDACHLCHISYFKIFQDAFIYNFSEYLNSMLISEGIISHDLKYYPEICKEKLNKIDKVFFWSRRPSSAINFSCLFDYFYPYINAFHIHDRSDPIDKNEIHNIKKYESIDNLCITNWFVHKKDVLSFIGESKFYIAPRECEGIGMAFLEAMADGCIVFANNAPTHNEYIVNGYNGFLIDFDSNDKERIKYQINSAFKIIGNGIDISGNAIKSIGKGHDNWAIQEAKLLSSLECICQSNSERYSAYKTFKIGNILAKIYYRSPHMYMLAIRLAYMIKQFFNIKYMLVKIIKTPLYIIKKIATKIS